MKTQTIEVEGLPEGWKTIRYGWPKKNVDYVFDGIGVKLFLGKEDNAMLIVEKIKPLEIRLVEIPEDEIHSNISETVVRIGNKWWKEVKETDIPLNSDGHKLSLSVDECKELLENTAHQSDAGDILEKFIKENS
jgi:hypothetical protein